MNRRTLGVVLRVVLVIGGSILAFSLFQESIREWEAHASAALVELVTGPGHAIATPGGYVVVVPHHDIPFRAVVTPSCSAAASAFTLVCLSLVLPKANRGRRLAATLAAVAVVVFGNVFRIAASLAAGVYAGRASLVLFHDWVGGVLTFAYTLGGYILMLVILLPGRRSRTAVPSPVLAPLAARAPEELTVVP